MDGVQEVMSTLFKQRIGPNRNQMTDRLPNVLHSWIKRNVPPSTTVSSTEICGIEGVKKRGKIMDGKIMKDPRGWLRDDKIIGGKIM